MNDLKEKLKQKGWTDYDIQKAVAIIENAKNKKSKKIIFLDSFAYWLALLIALIGNFVISIILIPFLLTMSGIKLYSIIIIIGFAFGAFFDILIRDIEKIRDQKVIIAGVFLPLLALINISLMVKFSNYLQQRLILQSNANSPLLIGLVYVCAFILPYVIKGLISLRKDIIFSAQN